MSDLADAAAIAAGLSESARQDLGGYQQDLAALAARWPSTPDQVHQPVILVHERTDRIVPLRHEQALAAAPPDAALQTTDDGHLSVIGHLPPSPAPCSAHRDHPPHGPAMANRH